MATVISVRFKPAGKAYFFDPGELEIQKGDHVIVDTARGPECGEVVAGCHSVPDASVVQPLKPVVRMADSVDIRRMNQNRADEKRAFSICEERIRKHGLEMKLVEAEYTLDRSKILFYFTADGRIDFRDLVKDLAGVFHTRIELRQIGVRDEAKMLGGLGICGRPFCCASFLDDFQPVSIKMAKTQSLSLNPTKISGTCGRLMCCLKYEQDAYEDAVKRMPKNESFVETPEGVGTVSQVNLLRETVKVRLDDAPEAPRSFHNCEICVVRNGKGKRPEGYVAPPPEELAKLRKVTPPPEDPEEKLRSSLGTALTGLGLTASVHTEEKQAEAKGGRSRSRSRNRGGEAKGGEKAEQAPRQAQEPKPQKKEAPKPRPEQKKAEPKPQGEGKPRAEKRPDRPQQKPKGDKPRQERPPQQAQQQPKAKPAEGANPAPAAEGGEKKSTRHRHRRYRPRSKGEGGGNPPAPQG